jgi:ubiquitin-protein ligase
VKYQTSCVGKVADVKLQRLQILVTTNSQDIYTSLVFNVKISQPSNYDPTPVGDGPSRF